MVEQRLHGQSLSPVAKRLVGRFDTDVPVATTGPVVVTLSLLLPSRCHWGRCYRPEISDGARELVRTEEQR
jgi:hypothetical protein